MELKAVNGMVEYRMRAGSDMVSGQMTHAEAKEMVASGDVKEKDGQIIVNGKFIFGDIKDVEPTESEEPKTDEPKETKKKSKPRRTRRAKK